MNFEREFLDSLLGKNSLNHGTPGAAKPQPHDCTNERWAPKFRRLHNFCVHQALGKSAHASKILDVSRTEGHGKGKLIRIGFTQLYSFWDLRSCTVLVREMDEIGLAAQVPSCPCSGAIGRFSVHSSTTA